MWRKLGQISSSHFLSHLFLLSHPNGKREDWTWWWSFARAPPLMQQSNCMMLHGTYTSLFHTSSSMVTMDRYQPEGCHRPAGSCLFEQLDDFHNEATWDTWEQMWPLVIHSRNPCKGNRRSMFNGLVTILHHGYIFQIFMMARMPG